MKSHRDKEFRELYDRLERQVKKKAIEAYILFKENQFNSSLQFKVVNPAYNVWSVRVGWTHRALGVRDPKDEIVWYWIGDHKEYERRIKQPPPKHLIR